MTTLVDHLQVKLFADGADLKEMIEMNSKTFIQGLTTNPTLMRKAGVSNYKAFAKEVLNQITIKPVSFEVFTDDLEEMKFQALEIAGWADNVYVKIPITNTAGKSTASVIDFLVARGVKVNITAIMTLLQVESVIPVLDPSVPSYISVFAGRIADTGRDPEFIISKSLNLIRDLSSTELIWASPRELLNVFQADKNGCHIITATKDILNKIDLIGKDLDLYSLETVKMFYTDAKASCFTI
jgi:transaldolase